MKISNPFKILMTSSLKDQIIEDQKDTIARLQKECDEKSNQIFLLAKSLTQKHGTRDFLMNKIHDYLGKVLENKEIPGYNSEREVLEMLYEETK